MEGLSRDEILARWDEIIKSGGHCSPEEHNLIQRMISANLAQSFGGREIRRPLSLVDPDLSISDQKELTAIQRDYVASVERYASHNMVFFNTLEQQKELAGSISERREAEEEEEMALDKEILEMHLEVTRLEKEQNRRETVMRSLGELETMPAGQPDFLNPEIMYRDCRPLPEMPKQMIDGFAIDHSATESRAEELLQDLKKHVLRSKLVAQREQLLDEQSEARKPFNVKGLSPEAKLYALNAVKNALIQWIETQLAKAGDDGADSDLDQEPVTTKTEYDHEAVMAGLQQKYQRHIELRQNILDQLAQMDHIKEQLKTTATDANSHHAQQKPVVSKEPSQSAHTPDAYLFTPYIEQFQTLARQQKAMMQQKSHVNTTLAKQKEDTIQALEHLAGKSRLLPRYPIPKEPNEAQPNFEDATSLIGKMKITEQVQPWLYAADEAKLATLVEVAENVEVGMESVNEARGYMAHICKLLDIAIPGQGQETALPGNADAEATSKNPVKAPTKGEKAPVKTIWDMLDGNLGSINE
ncbi:hypothetical protein PFICI_00570 [Pestalotiopsis fici W106-1]|uniref:Uncharacterized protein n=1 Tax=Pestalotiopsis fici (strain W106-1 / CGMCC3.15140) TaxID=1229662 RepID=W3XMM1_PESFW|nr:uncharacterized protein PFICI_00570 [Pestalotiopsis fici W106-1]ETS86742.1 hypothetical protein PFICI_00570 [Pestalotiopsis fici W106-1]